MTLPDTVLAFMLLCASNLDEVDRKVIMSSIKEVTYAYMKSSLKRFFARMRLNLKVQACR